MAFDSRILCYTICDSLSGGVMDGFLFRNPNSCFKSINRYEKRVFVIALTLCQNKIIKGNICRINET